MMEMEIWTRGWTAERTEKEAEGLTRSLTLLACQLSCRMHDCRGCHVLGVFRFILNFSLS
jgi:hypothetical protein